MKKKLLLIIVFLITFGLEYFAINGIIENKLVDKLIEDFKGKAQFDEMNSTKRRKFYTVEKEVWMEDLSSFNDDQKRVGRPGDLLVSRISPFNNIFGKFTGYFYGGHAAAISPSGNTIYEVAGTVEEDFVKESTTNWALNRTEFIGLRVKATPDERIQFLKNIEKRFGEPYNYSFIFNTKNSHYCTDLMSKSYREVGKHLDLNDGFITSVNDIILSKNTYIFYYQEEIGSIQNIYYLK